MLYPRLSGLHNGLLIPNWSVLFFSVLPVQNAPLFLTNSNFLLSVSTLKNVFFILKGEIKTSVLSWSYISFFRADSWDTYETLLATAVDMEAVNIHLPRYAPPILLFILEALNANEFLLPIPTAMCHPYCKRLQRDCSRF